MVSICRLAAAAAVLALTAGCLKKETTHTIYISPDNSVRWMAEESDVVSDLSEPRARDAEEREYTLPALMGAHSMALALQMVAPDAPVQTIVVRDERPFHVITGARSGRIDYMLARLFSEAGLPAAVELTDSAGEVRLGIGFDFSLPFQPRDTPATLLAEDFGSVQFVLTDGWFVEGGGLEIQSPARARISESWLAMADEAMNAGTSIQLVLTWRRGARRIGSNATTSPRAGPISSRPSPPSGTPGPGEPTSILRSGARRLPWGDDARPAGRRGGRPGGPPAQ